MPDHLPPPHGPRDALRVRTHGTAGPWVVCLHGGPAAVGGMRPVAEALADRWRVLEPWQRGSGGAPLTVARHVEDVRQLIADRCGRRPALVGHSWGAMLALAFAAAHPDAAGPLVLVGCGTFDTAARARRKALLAERTGADLRAKLDELETACPDPAARLRRKYKLADRLHAWDPIDPGPPPEPEPFDMRAHQETWADMLRRQEAGDFPAALAAVGAPVLMLHGDWDPHPGRMIRDGLRPHLPHLEYVELARCGHTPWNERAAREPFFSALRTWLARTHGAGH